MSSDKDLVVCKKEFVWSEIIQNEIETRAAKEIDDPFFITNIDDILEKYKYWNFRFPRIQPFFAIKCSHNVHAPNFLVKLGCGFDCASRGEIERVLKLGIHPDRIIFANTIKQESHIKYARDNKVFKLVFDSSDELRKIQKIFPEAKVVIRVYCDSKKSSFNFAGKYGCDKEEARELVKLCKELNLNFVGACFHVGPNDDDFEVYVETLVSMTDLFEFAKTVGFDPKFIDIGGAFHGRFKEALDVYEKPINEIINQYFADPSYQIISEPGQYFVTSSAKLLCNVVTKKIKRSSDGSIDCIQYGVNESMYQSFVSSLTRKIMKPPRNLSKNSENRRKYNTIIYGISCDSTDILLSDILWEEAFVGEWLVFDNFGAYTGACATPFNGFEKTADVSYISEENW